MEGGEGRAKRVKRYLVGRRHKALGFNGEVIPRFVCPGRNGSCREPLGMRSALYL
jgi:hypothetical protein